MGPEVTLISDESFLPNSCLALSWHYYVTHNFVFNVHISVFNLLLGTSAEIMGWILYLIK